MSRGDVHTPDVDLVLVFRAAAAPAAGTSKDAIKKDAEQAEREYTRLLDTIKAAGLRATGKRGQKNGQILVFIWASTEKLARLVKRERYTDFLRGLPASQVLSSDGSTPSSDLTDASKLAPADRLRIIYEFITSTEHDGGLGIVSGSVEWPRVESVFALHNRQFNEMWMHSWTHRQIGFRISRDELDKIREEFGESVALYFAFLSSYTQSLVYIAALGIGFFLLRLPYSAIYSTLLVLWSVTFVEYWRVCERKLSVRWGCRGSVRVERKRAQYRANDEQGAKFPWWKRDMRIFASIPVVLFFAGILAAILTGIFLFEAFVTALYTGPGHMIIGFSPTLLFLAFVPQLLALYHKYAVRLTEWENHSHQSTFDASLTIKTFALSAIVAYLGLALSAFVYMPFGEQLMEYVSSTLFATSAAVNEQASKAAQFINGTGTTSERIIGTSEGAYSIWARGAKTDPARLQNQMFAFTVTQQAIGTFTEVGLPFITRKIEAMRFGSGSGSKAGKATGNVKGNSSSTKTETSERKGKRVVFDDEESGNKDEREFLAVARHEASLPNYELFADYSEMVTQFGYVALWSTIWPLAPVMALLNNWLELRSDAFKIATHVRRPLPSRTDTIGPWLDNLSFLAWLSALTNAALVYLFRPDHFSSPPSSIVTDGSRIDTPTFHPDENPTFHINSQTSHVTLLLPALLVALCASHLHGIARGLVRHCLERALWKGGKEARAVEDGEMNVKGWFLKSLGVDDVEGAVKDLAGVTGEKSTGDRLTSDTQFGPDGEDSEDTAGFWLRDEGLDEVRKNIKDA